MTIEVNNVDVPVDRVEESMFSASNCGTETLTPRINNRNILDMALETNFTYRKNYYYNLYDVNGNFIEESKKFNVVTKKELYFWDELERFSSKRVVFYLNGDFRIVNLMCKSMNRQEEVTSITDVINTYCRSFTQLYRQQHLPTYTIYTGHSRSCLGLLKRSDLKMTYKELGQKRDRIIEMCINNETSKFDNEFDQEWISESFDHIIDAICDYLFITKTQYKKATYNLIDKLNKRLNYNINNR